MTVAEALDTDSTELPPLEGTISADALDRLSHRENHPLGAHTGFPYSGLWVVAYTDGNIDVFENYRGATVAERLPNDSSELTTDEPAVVLHFRDERYAFHEDRLDTFHEIVTEAEDGDEAREETVQFARQQPTGQAASPSEILLSSVPIGIENTRSTARQDKGSVSDAEPP